MAFCENCGEILSGNATFCENCGAAVKQRAPKEQQAVRVLKEFNCIASSEPGETVVGTWTQGAPAAIAAASDVVKKAASAAAPNAPKSKKTKGKILPALVIVVLLAVGVYAFMAWWPGFHTSTPPESSPSAAASNNTANANATSTANKNTSNSTASNANKNSSNKNSNSNSAANSNKNSNKNSNSNSASNANKNANANSGTGGSSTRLEPNGNPRFADFDWYLDLPRLDAVPSFGKQIKDFSTIVGNWKCMFLFDSAGEANQASRELLFVRISGKTSDFSVTLDPYKIEFGNEVVDETKTYDIKLKGSWSDKNGTVKGTGSAMFTINAFYSYNKAQYALGRLKTASGEGATVLMMRP